MLLRNYVALISYAVLSSVAVSASPVITAAPTAALAVRGQIPTQISGLPVLIERASDPSTTTDSTTATCTPTIAPDKNGYVPPESCNANYNYYPSFGAAVALTVMFGMLLIGHITQAVIYKKGFCWVVIMGTSWEVGSFVTRVLSTRDQQNQGLATISQLLFLLAPLWINAFDYMILARMIYFFIPDKKIWFIKPSALALVFVTLDFGSFLIQAAGGSMIGPGASYDTIMRGLHLYMGGIGVQEFFIILFLGLSIKFHLEMLKLERTRSLVGTAKAKWRPMLYALYASLIAITVRVIFRLAEFSDGTSTSNPIITHEVYIYIFDAVPMLVAIFVWNWVHPGATLQGPDSIMPPGWLSRHCCCCCIRKKKKTHQRVPSEERLVNEELPTLQPQSHYPPPYKRPEYVGA